MKLRTTVLALLSIALVACGSDAPDETTEIITVADGATIEVANATIEVPANAVSADTEVTVSIGSIADYQQLADARDLVIEFDPPMALESSASIEIDIGDPAPLATDFAQLHQFTDGVWIGVDVSTIIDEDGRVHSAINLLAPTAVVITTPDPT